MDNVNLMFIGECNLVGCGMMNLSLTHGVSSQVDTVLVDMIPFWRQCQVLYQKVIAYQIKKIETWARECAAIQRVVVVMLVCVLPLVGLVACADDGGDSDGADSKADIDLTDKRQWFLSHFDSAFDNRCPGYDPRTLKVVILGQPHVPVVLRPDLVDQIAEAIRQDLEDPVTIDNLEIEDAGDATLVTVHDSGALGDPSTGPNQRRDGTPFFRIIQLYAEAHFEDGMTVFFRVYVNLDDTEQGCVVSGVAIPPLDFVP